MTIEQKAREIAEGTKSVDGVFYRFEVEKAARLGIIEGRRQAFEEAAAKVKALWLAGEPYSEVYDHIRALIEEQK